MRGSVVRTVVTDAAGAPEDISCAAAPNSGTASPPVNSPWNSGVRRAGTPRGNQPTGKGKTPGGKGWSGRVPGRGTRLERDFLHREEKFLWLGRKYGASGGDVGVRSLYEVLAAARAGGNIAVMVDVKFRSPRDGELIPESRLESYVRALVDGGVDALSTPTDPVYFDGSVEKARRIRRAAGVPLMRKEFFRTIEQIDESHEAGFDAVQLSLSTVPDIGLFRRMKARAERLGMEVVVGVHSAAQLETAVDLGAVAVGINNRDITVLEMDDGTVSLSESLMAGLPDGMYAISESSFRTGADVARAAEAGADAVLVGTAVAKSDDPAATVRTLRNGAEAWGR
ncbi:indole-3-glycerol-phosphate synthase [Thermobifida halotolerans]|nr:indole-3-glycerol-phosphate synthase [Thermobifida halotolerans]